jgi:hypothetical protein
MADVQQNNWNSLGCDVSEELLLETSQKLLDLGLRDVGYKYVVLDDCWSDGRDEDGYLVADRTRFPRGMKFVADAIHEKGLLYGMYSSAGEYTCARYGMFAAPTFENPSLIKYKLGPSTMKSTMRNPLRHGVSIISNTTTATPWADMEPPRSRTTASTSWPRP